MCIRDSIQLVALTALEPPAVFNADNFRNEVVKVYESLAPLIGMVVAFGFTLLVLYICRRAHPHTAEVWFKKLQLVSSALFSIEMCIRDSHRNGHSFVFGSGGPAMAGYIRC